MARVAKISIVALANRGVSGRMEQGMPLGGGSEGE